MQDPGHIIKWKPHSSDGPRNVNNICNTLRSLIQSYPPFPWKH